MSSKLVLLPDVEAKEKSQDTVSLTLYVPETLHYFQGHFPGTPILAGVVQLDWAVHFGLSELGYTNKQAKNLEVVKFQVVITPESRLTLHLSKKSSDKFLFKFESEKGVHASGRVVVEDAQ